MKILFLFSIVSFWSCCFAEECDLQKSDTLQLMTAKSLNKNIKEVLVPSDKKSLLFQAVLIKYSHNLVDKLKILSTEDSVYKNMVELLSLSNKKIERKSVGEAISTYEDFKGIYNACEHSLDLVKESQKYLRFTEKSLRLQYKTKDNFGLIAGKRQMNERIGIAKKLVSEAKANLKLHKDVAKYSCEKLVLSQVPINSLSNKIYRKSCVCRKKVASTQSWIRKTHYGKVQGKGNTEELARKKALYACRKKVGSSRGYLESCLSE